MTGERLTNFCHYLCAAMKDGAAEFRFEGERVGTIEGRKLAAKWIEEEKRVGARS